MRDEALEAVEVKREALGHGPAEEDPGEQQRGDALEDRVGLVRGEGGPGGVGPGAQRELVGVEVEVGAVLGDEIGLDGGDAALLAAELGEALGLGDLGVGVAPAEDLAVEDEGLHGAVVGLEGGLEERELLGKLGHEFGVAEEVLGGVDETTALGVFDVGGAGEGVDGEVRAVDFFLDHPLVVGGEGGGEVALFEDVEFGEFFEFGGGGGGGVDAVGEETRGVEGEAAGEGAKEHGGGDKKEEEKVKC